MGILKGVAKLMGSAALVATGTASTIVRGMMNAVGFEEGADLMGRAQDASFEKIRDMWTPDDKKDDEYYEAMEERRNQRAETSERWGEEQRKKY